MLNLRERDLFGTFMADPGRFLQTIVSGVLLKVTGTLSLSPSLPSFSILFIIILAY
jgi:hypothetical protein